MARGSQAPEEKSEAYFLGEKIETDILPSGFDQEEWNTFSNGKRLEIHLKKRVSEVLWMTYRTNFSKLVDSDFIDDNGWGCLIRVG